ncbi:hypothetical protein A0H81_02836 [Grifola frondosa]|uniref:Uncharacterized protein n=1 Tax=Grifola frondosa TaxID=5627 RepID=A0A1C7MN91_GRIFR|nr:hypothetical protein A0H81_02836 [Grifola frondosa]
MNSHQFTFDYTELLSQYMSDLFKYKLNKATSAVPIAAPIPSVMISLAMVNESICAVDMMVTAYNNPSK